ncbi:hypothetical protein [Aeromicrobium sp. 50.2.37]|uniref:hypothetical protein n=1 Tax=Aeromicrobium sp. 50.2.37 TaxID=2969305 RepID=UPI00214F7F3E|nr:hypothetical protein [Aeromicrobium sp. 50.2.37]MCR4514020.1 hypothetical protein [Aeromicrobium sp. 50.2.37]
MIAEEHRIASPQTRSQLWANLLRLETLGEWSAVSRCASTDSDRLDRAQSYLCSLQHGQDHLDATVVVTHLDPPEELRLRTTSPMAVVNERIVLEPDGRGTLVRYSASASSSMFGPAVTVWLHDHVRLVQDRLSRYVQRADLLLPDEG